MAECFSKEDKCAIFDELYSYFKEPMKRYSKDLRIDELEKENKRLRVILEEIVDLANEALGRIF